MEIENQLTIGKRKTLTSMTEFDAPPPLTKILNELVDGAPPGGAYVLNAGDPGLLKSLKKLSAQDASAVPVGGTASVAAHVDHLRYGFELFHRWSNGEEPYSTADWNKSWERNVVTDKEWQDRLKALEDELDAWRVAMQKLRPLNEMEQNGVVGIVVHLAYHVGAIRQIHRGLRGPSANEAVETHLDPQQLG